MSPLDRAYPTGCLALLGTELLVNSFLLGTTGITEKVLRFGGYLAFGLTLAPLVLYGGIGFRRWLDAHAPRVTFCLVFVSLAWAMTYLGVLVLPPALSLEDRSSAVAAMGGWLLVGSVCALVSLRGLWLALFGRARRGPQASVVSIRTRRTARSP